MSIIKQGAHLLEIVLSNKADRGRPTQITATAAAAAAVLRVMRLPPCRKTEKRKFVNGVLMPLKMPPRKTGPMGQMQGGN